MRIREFKIGDYPEVRRLWEECGLEIRPGDSLAEVKRKTTRDPELFLVAEERGSVVGSVMGAWDGRRGWLYHLGVHPARRREGTAAKLVAEVEMRMKKKGVLKVNAVVYDTNVPSLEFFRKAGYTAERTYVHHGKMLTPAPLAKGGRVLSGKRAAKA